jgi:hypothetical protein
MRLFLNKLIAIFSIVFFFDAICIGAGENEIFQILQARNNANPANRPYPNLNRNIFYLAGNVVHAHMPGSAEADIEFTDNLGNLFVIEVKSSWNSFSWLGSQAGGYVIDQLDRQRNNFPVNTTIKIVFDIRNTGYNLGACQILQLIVNIGGIALTDVGFLIANNQLVQVDGITAWWP